MKQRLINELTNGEEKVYKYILGDYSCFGRFLHSGDSI